MANKNLKSIKFPGLTDTYVVPQVDNTLTQADRPADAKKTGDEIDALKEDLSTLTGKPSYTMSVGFINKTTGAIESSGYHVSSLIPVNVGDHVTFSTQGSSNVFVLGMYSTDSGNADINESIVGKNEYVTESIIIPTGISYIRGCVVDVKLSDFSLYINDIKTDVTLLKYDIDLTSRNRFGLLGEHRVATINFQFDDGSPKDAQIVSIFKNNNAVCGFALLSSMGNNARTPEYLGYQKDGFEILAHSTDGTPMNDATVEASVIEEKLIATKASLEQGGFIVRGWVTPSSVMDEKFITLVDKYYDFAYTKYFGTYAGSGTPYFTANGDVYRLSRVSVQGTTLADMKSAVDIAIANKGFLTFYGHAAALDTTDNETTENLNELLSYIEAKQADLQCALLAPSDAIDFYFHTRHEDVTGDGWIDLTPNDVSFNSDLELVASGTPSWYLRYNPKLKLCAFTARIKATSQLTGQIMIAQNLPFNALNQGVVIPNDGNKEALIYNNKIFIVSGTWNSGTSIRFNVVAPIA